MGGIQLSRVLSEAGVIEPGLTNAIREMYSVSSPAIHAEDVSQPKVSFVREVGPQLVGALRVIGGTAV
jgi:hypothetical protein